MNVSRLSDPSVYVLPRKSIHRNLYRSPLPCAVAMSGALWLISDRSQGQIQFGLCRNEVTRTRVGYFTPTEP